MHEERNGRPGRRYDEMTEQEKAEEAIDRVWDEMGIIENVFPHRAPERSGNKIEGAMWDEGTRMINAQNQSPVVTDKELIVALRVEVPFALFNGTQDDWDAAEIKLQAAADRLQALTQPSGKKVFEYGGRVYFYEKREDRHWGDYWKFIGSELVPDGKPSGKVSDEQLRRGKEALQVLNRRKMTCAEIAKVVLEAAQLHARPVVKALEWEELTSPREDGTSEPTGDIEAQTLIGEYSVCFDDDEDVSATPWCVWSPVENIGHFADFYEAKAAAHADYERRILSALEGEA